jgi:hypothetical protein
MRERVKKIYSTTFVPIGEKEIVASKHFNTGRGTYSYPAYLLCSHQLPCLYVEPIMWLKINIKFVLSKYTLVSV